MLNIPDMLFGIEGVVGSRFADRLSGNVGANTHDGGLGADTMAGGAGGDHYRVDNAADLVIETVLGGVADTVESSVNHTLAANVE